MKKALDLQRTRESPVEFLRLRALRLAPSLGIDPGEALECIGILENAFGIQWLNDASEERLPTAVPLRRHPLGNLVSTAGETQVAEAIEVAGYLRQLVQDPKLPAVIEGLRAQYDQTLLQLAFADRLRSVGATQIELEPDAANGRVSDIRFVLNAKSYRVECYRPTIRSNVAHEESTRLAKSALASVADAPIVLSIAIALNRPLTPTVRKELLRVLKQVVRRVIAQASSDTECFPTYCLVSEEGAISVCRGLPTRTSDPPRLLVARTFPRQDGDFDMYMRGGFATRSQLVGIDGNPHAGIGLSHCAIWFDEATRAEHSLEQDLSKPLASLGKKIERKLVQARSTVGDRRIVVVESWVASQLARAPSELICRLRRKIVNTHTDVSALLLVLRGWNAQANRYEYQVYSLWADAVDPALKNSIARFEA